MRKSAGLVAAAAVLVACALPSGASAARMPRETIALVRAQANGIAPGNFKTVDAKCPRGYEVLGGSYFIGGDAVFAHAAGAFPDVERRLFRVIVANPLANPLPELGGPHDASVAVGGICAESGKPIVVDGAFGAPGSPDLGHQPSTVLARRAGADDIENNTVATVDAKCRSDNHAVFGGGYSIAGSLWPYPSSASVLSRQNAYQGELVSPPFDPTLGILRRRASMRSLALCARKGAPIVLNSDPDAAEPPRGKPRKKLKGTVVLVKKTVGGIRSGTIKGATAKCPQGYSVFGGSQAIQDSATAHATVSGVQSRTNSYTAEVVNPPASVNAGIPRSTAQLVIGALCAKRSTPIVVDGPFPTR